MVWKLMVFGKQHLPFYQMFFVSAATAGRALELALANAREAGAEEAQLEDEVELSSEDRIPPQMPRLRLPTATEGVLAKSGMAFVTDDLASMPREDA